MLVLERGIPVNQQPYKVEKVRLVGKDGKETYTRNYYFKDKEGKQVIIREDSLKYEFKNGTGVQTTEGKGGKNKVDKKKLEDSKETLKEEAEQPVAKKENKGETKEWNGKYKKKKPDVSGKKGAKDAPSWAKEYYPREGESGKEFAKRIMDEKYGAGNYEEGVGTQFNKIKKWADRSFE